MVKHTQTIRRQQPTCCLSVFESIFWGWHLKGSMALLNIKYNSMILQNDVEPFSGMMYEMNTNPKKL